MALDPSKVPTYPVINLAVTADGEAFVDNQPVAVPDGQEPKVAGVQAVAEKIASQGLGAARVRAVAPEGEYTMVVSADGEVVDTTAATEAPIARRRPSLVVIGLIGCALLAIGGAGTATVMAVTEDEPEPVSTVPPPLPGAGANLPVQAPIGYAQKAEWSVPVGDRTQALVTRDGDVVITTPDDDLSLLDGATGDIAWTGRDSDTELHLSSVSGRPVVASSSNDSLSLWPLDMTSTASVPATQLGLAGSAEVSYLGSMPLVELPNQTVTMFDGDRLALRDVPVGATPVMSTPEGVIAVSADAWWTVTTDAEPVSRPLPRPDAAEGDPLLVSAPDDTQLVVAWATHKQDVDVLALIDLATSSIRKETTLASNAIRDDAEPIHDPTGQTMTLGPVLIDYGPDPLLVDLGTMTPAAVNDRTVYGTIDQQPAVLEWGTSLQSKPVPEAVGDVVTPVAITDELAYVITEKVNETRLYALPRTEGMDQ